MCGQTKDLIPNFVTLLGTARTWEWAGLSFPDGLWEVKYIPRGTTYHRTVGCIDFDFIECFTTTFLRAHSWLNWVDEDDDDEVGLKEKPEDTRYIKKITSK